MKSVVQNRWVILTCACAVLAIHGGLFLSFGVLFVDLLEEFGDSRAQTATIQSINVAVTYLASFFVGFIVNKCHARICGCIACFLMTVALATSYLAQGTTFLIISFGVIGGIAGSFIILSGMKTVLYTFEGSTQKLALALLVTMPSVGAIPYPYFLRYLSDSYGIHLSFLITGCLMGSTIPFTLTWNVLKQETDALNDIHDKPKRENVAKGKTHWAISSDISKLSHKKTVQLVGYTSLFKDNQSDLESIKPNNMVRQTVEINKTKTENDNWKVILKALVMNVLFLLFVFGHALAGSSFRVLGAILTDVLKEMGLASSETTLALMVMNFTGIPGRLLDGLVKKIPRGSSFVCVVVLTVCACPAIIGLNFVKHQTISVILCGVCGLAFGAVHASAAVSVLSLVGTDYGTPAVGLSFGVTGIFVAITGPLSGSIRDSSTSYSVTLSILSGAVLAGSVFYFLSFMLKRRKYNRQAKICSSMERDSKESVFSVSTRL